MKRVPVAGKTIAIISIAATGVVLAGSACGLLLGWLNSPPPSANLAQERSMSADAVPSSASAAIGALAATPVGNETTGTIRPAPAAGSATGLGPAPAAAPKLAARVCVNPNAMGVARVVEIDTTGGPGFGFQHFKAYDFLNDHEVVLTFDDGPWLGHTPAVLKALADQCLRATFFSIGKHATYYPEILKRVVAAGHTVGSHTWSHADLQAVVKNGGADAAKEEFEKGASAVRMMAGVPIAPFFRFPDLRHPPEMLTYLGERNVASFSTDIDSWDFKIKKPEELTKSLMGKLRKAGKGIILMHDFQKVTSIALPQILDQLQKDGFKVVHMVPRGTLSTLPQYDEAVLKENKLPTLMSRPADTVVRTISQ
jgi:peptidoglycan/xylan/chitin deacetylase (PgdA/CDA1 family)